MKKIVSFILFIICLTGMQNLSGANIPDTLRFEGLLSKAMVKEANINDSFIGSLDVTRSKHILLSTNSRMYLLGWGGLLPFGTSSDQKIDAFSINKEGFVIVMRDKELCFLDSVGHYSRIVSLPNSDMGITAGDSLLYIYDKNLPAKNSLYVVAKGGKYMKLFSSPSPFNAVTEANHDLIFATGCAVFSLNPISGELKGLASVGNGNDILSIAYDAQNNIIYFSTKKAIYYIKKATVYQLSNQYGGTLKFFLDGLIVFNPETQTMLRLVGISNQL